MTRTTLATKAGSVKAAAHPPGYAIIALPVHRTGEPAMAKHPLYKEVKQQLTRSLIDGEWRPGEMLPSEPRLAERYGVGISTVRAAVRELEQA